MYYEDEVRWAAQHDWPASLQVSGLGGADGETEWEASLRLAHPEDAFSVYVAARFVQEGEAVSLEDSDFAVYAELDIRGADVERFIDTEDQPLLYSGKPGAGLRMLHAHEDGLDFTAGAAALKALASRPALDAAARVQALLDDHQARVDAPEVARQAIVDAEAGVARAIAYLERVREEERRALEMVKRAEGRLAQARERG